MLTNAVRCKRLRFDSWVGTIPYILPGESHGQRSLVGHSLEGHKELDTTEATYHVRARTHTHTHTHTHTYSKNLKVHKIYRIKGTITKKIPQ